MSEPAANGNRAGGLRTVVGSMPFRVAVSIAVLGILLLKIGVVEVIDKLIQAKLELVVAGMLIYLAANLVNIYKWQLILAGQGDRVPFRNLFSIFYVGVFFNNLLLTNFGGDVIRVMRLARLTERPAVAAGSVVADRVSSTFALLLIAVVPAIFQLRLLGWKWALLVISMFLLSVLVIALLASERAVRRLGRLPLLRGGLMGLREHVRHFYYSLYELRGQKGVLALVMLISLFYQALQIVTIYLLGLALEIEISIINYFLFIPIVLAVSMLPISLNGLGVREGAWVALFSLVSVPDTAALSLSLLTLLLMSVVSLLGGAFYLFDRKTVPLPQR